jgi:hypothetical protein
MKMLAMIAVGMILGGAMVGCGGASPTTITPTASVPQAAAETSIVATVESKYDEAWAREQVESVAKEVAEVYLAQDWNKLYDLHPDEARVGCSRSTFVSKMVKVWPFAAANGGDGLFKGALQDLEEGNLAVTFTAITPEHITFVAGDTPHVLVRERGKWMQEFEPLGQDCSSLDMPWEE